MGSGRSVWLFGAIAIFAASLPVGTAQAQDSWQHRARLVSPLASPREVASGGFLWSCKSSLCVAISANPNPTIAACSALAAKVGRIAAFGSKVKSLDPAALAQCAKHAAIANREMPPPKPGTASKTVTGDHIVARLASSLTSPRDVASNGRRWACKGSLCVAGSADINPSIEVCSSLAAKVGRIAAFGNKRKSLDPAALAQCSKRAAIVIREAPPPRPEAGGRKMPDDSRVVAKLARPVASPRDVSSGGSLWSCKGSLCVARSAAANPTIEGCSSLAAKVGRIAAFGSKLKSLGRVALEECARRVAIANRSLPPPATQLLPPKDRSPRKVPGIDLKPHLPPIVEKQPESEPVPEAEPATPPPPAESSPEPSEPGIIDTASLVLNGSDEPPRPAAPPLPVNISTGTLRIEGEYVRSTFRPVTIDTSGFVLNGE